MSACSARSCAGRHQRGFTLMEVIVVVVIIAIMAMITLPIYQNSLRKGQRSDGKAGLLAVASRMEQYILDRGRYTYDMTNLGYATDPWVSEEGHYDIDASACTGGDESTCYVLTATPRSTSPLAQDKDCTSFILAYTGAKSATGAHADQCWN